MTTCIQLKYIPRGCLLKLHSNSNSMGYKAVLENCSKKLMISTAVYYKKLLRPLKLEFERIKILISDKWKENYERVNRRIIKGIRT